MSLEREELEIVSTLLCEPPEELPPFLGKLLDDAPKSFECEPYGIIAVHIREQRAAGKPISSGLIFDRLSKANKLSPELTVAISLCSQNVVRIDLVEVDAEKVWGSYQSRITSEAIEEAQSALQKAPEHRSTIISHLVSALEHVSDSTGSLADLLNARKFNPLRKPPPLRAVYSLAGVPTCTPGNLTTITAQAKAGKSAFVGALMAAAMVPEGVTRDTLGASSRNPNGFALLHFDTEQSPDDHWHQIDRARCRAGIETLPDWMTSHCLTGLSVSECNQAFRSSLRKAAQTCRGVHSVFIDGVGDMVNNVNDPPECNPFVASLHRLAIDYDCPIISVLHFNPGTDKPRGHLGSQMERKSESNIRLDKDHDVTVVWSAIQRRAPISKDAGPRFKWEPSAGMHVSVESTGSKLDLAKREKLILARDEVWGDKVSMRYSEIISTFMKVMNYGDSKAYRIFDILRKEKMIEKYPGNLWTKKDLQ